MAHTPHFVGKFPILRGMGIEFLAKNTQKKRNF